MTLLEIERASSFYGDFQALFDVSLHVDEGETVAIIGSNGAGKSTLLRLIAGLLPIAAARSATTARSSTTSRPTTASARASRWCRRAAASSPA